MAGRFREPDVAWNDGIEKPVFEIFAERIAYLLRQIGAVVVHGEQDALDGDVGVDGAANALQGGNELGNAFKGEIFGLHGDNQAVCGPEDVEGEQVKSRRTIKNDEVEHDLERRKGAAEAQGAIRGSGQLDVGACQVFGAWKDAEKADLGRQDHLLRGRVSHEDVVNGVAIIVALKAEARRGIGLGVAIYEEYFQAFESQACGEVNCGGRLANSAFLIDDAENLAHERQEYRKEGGAVRFSIVENGKDLWKASDRR